MKRFNQYINGERDFKLEEFKDLDLKDEKQIKQEKAQEEYDNYLKNLEKERIALKDLIYNSLIGQGLFIDDMLSDQQRKEIKDKLTIENIQVEESENTYAHYKCNIVDLIMDKAEPIMEKSDYLQTCLIVIGSDQKLLEGYKPYTGPEAAECIILHSRTYISDTRAKKVLFEKEEEKLINEHNEIKYLETGREKEIAQAAGNSRPYTDFFSEFVPNTMEESKRAHKYTVSIHRAIWYEENFEVFKKFDKIRFNKDRVKSDFEGFLTNSPLYDPTEPNLVNSTTYKDDNRIDGQRKFKDEDVYPEYHGAYHIQHRIDGKLVAVNVWDITENTLGSIYTFYDPAYSFLSLGNVTAVREMEYMRKIREKYNPNMKHYYMGYYVHNCQKSVYKEHMHPQNLLWPITHTYVPLTPELKSKIQKYQFFKLNEEAEESHHASPEKLAVSLMRFKFVYERNRWLALAAVREEMKQQMEKNISSIHSIMGDIFLDLFLFEYL